MTNFVADLRQLARSLARSPGFTTIAVLTLALGIGVTTAVVSVADHVLVRSLPFRDSGRLMMLVEQDRSGAIRLPSAPTAMDWQRDAGAQRAFEALTYIRGDGLSLRVGEDTRDVGTAFVTPEFFQILGARIERGRPLLADDHRPGAAPAAVITHRLWTDRFGSDPDILGRAIHLDSAPVTVVGVLPLGAVYPPFADVYRPVSQYRQQQILQQRGFHADSRTLARLRPGTDSAQAVALMRNVGTRLATEYPAEQEGWMPSMRAMRTEIIGGLRPMLLTLSGAAAAVLLLACANIANLLLARVTTRSRELAVRAALGATRWRIVRQLLSESVLLALAGGVLGMALAWFAIDLASTMMAAQLPRADELALDHRVLAVAAAASLLTALLCGLWPAFRATRTSGAEVLRASAAGSVGIRAESRMRRVLVTVQFALALVLLVGAGLLIQSFRRAASVDVGFDPRGVYTLRIAPAASAYPQASDAAALYARLMDAARTVPGVQDAAFIQHAPYSPAGMITSVELGAATVDSSNQVMYRTVSASYLQTMQMRMAAGRWFTSEDERSPGGAFVINEAMANRYWRGQNPIGERITIRRASQARPDFGQPLPGTVIGVVRNVHQQRQDVPPDPEVYVPYTLETWNWGNLVVRARDAAGASLLPSIVEAVRSVDARLVQPGQEGVAAFSRMEDAIGRSMQPRRFSMSLVGAFATCALLLAAIGIYGVVAYGVAQRSREIGVRKALGASDAGIASLIFGESLMMLALGVLLGGIGAWASARLIRAMLFDTGVVDPAVYLVAVIVLALTALLATWLPARRAMRLDPTITMRGE